MRRLAGFVLVIGFVASSLDAFAETHRGSAFRCLDTWERPRAVQADVQVLLKSKLTATLAAQNLRLYGALNGAKVRASLVDVVVSEPLNPKQKRRINASLQGTVKLSDGRICAVSGSAGSMSVNGTVYRWGRVDIGIACPDGARFTVGMHDSRITQPLGNETSLPPCPS